MNSYNTYNKVSFDTPKNQHINKKICPVLDDKSNIISHQSFCTRLCNFISPNNFIEKMKSVKVHNQEIIVSEFSNKINNSCSQCAAAPQYDEKEKKYTNNTKNNYYVEVVSSSKEFSNTIKTKPISSIINTNDNSLRIERSKHVSIPITDNIKDDFITTSSNSRYDLFNIKNPIITQEDCDEIKKSWKLIIDDYNLSYLKDLKKNKILPETTSAISWFYDTFYENVYIYDKNNNSNMVHIFKNNLKIQSHALIVIIENSISIAETYKSGKKYNFKEMNKVHDKIGIKYKNYVTIYELLLLTFDQCLKIQWTQKMELAWCKLISLLLKDILPHYIFQRLCSTIRRHTT